MINVQDLIQEKIQNDAEIEVWGVIDLNTAYVSSFHTFSARNAINDFYYAVWDHLSDD